MRLAALLLGGIALGTLTTKTQAQEAADAPASATTTPPVQSTAPADQGIADIVVTAQKRAENLQRTPLAITALGADTIRAKGINSVADLTAVAPSVSITTSPASATNIQVFIRGIGDADPILTSDSPVGLYVDGIILGRAAGSAFDILDLDRIEVLRGPQGTLYGRNTIGGAINLITRKPADTFGAEIAGSAGNLNYYNIKTSVDTGEIADGLKARFTYLHKQRDGYVNDTNASDGHDPGAYVLNAFRSAISFERGVFKVDYNFDYSVRKSFAAAFQLTAVSPDVARYLDASPLLGGAAPVVSTSRRDTLSLNQGEITDRVTGHTITAELDLGGGTTLRSLTGFRQWHNRNTGDDFDGNSGLVGFTVSPAVLAPPYTFTPLGVTPIDLFSTTDRRRQNQFSEEINLLGDIGSRFKYVLGGYYFDEHADEYNPQNLLLVVPSATPIPLTSTVTLNAFGVPLTSLYDYDHYNKSAAGFAQGTYDLTSKLSLTGGIRYTHDWKHLVQRAPFDRDLKADFGKVNYSASLNWQATPNILLYARTASGYKAGGFNARSTNSGFKPETLTSYETGIKTDLLDRHLRLNLTGFYAIHSDVQVQQLQAGTDGASSVTLNAGKARYWGIEGEITARPIEAVTIGGNVGYTNRKYRKFLVLDPSTDQIVDVKDSARFVVGATTTVSAYLQWDIAEFSVGKLSFRADYDYRGKIYYNPTTIGTPFNNEIAGDPRSLVGARLSLGDIKLRGTTGDVALWGKNIFDVKYREYGIDFGNLGYAGNTYAEPATYGVDFRLKL